MDNESGLGNLNKYMNQIMYDLIRSENITRLLTYNDASVYSKEPPKNPMELLYKNIFPFGYVPDIQTDVNSYITVEFDDFKPTRGNHFIYSFIVLSIFSHENIQNTNFGNRLLLLYDEVHKIMNNKDMGIGRLALDTGSKINTLKKPYSGHYLVYRLTDFNG